MADKMPPFVLDTDDIVIHNNYILSNEQGMSFSKYNPATQGYNCIRPRCCGVARFESTDYYHYPVRMSCLLCGLQTSEYVSEERAWAAWFQEDKDNFIPETAPETDA